MIDIKNIKIGDIVYQVWDGYAANDENCAVCDCKIYIYKSEIVALIEEKFGLFALATNKRVWDLSDVRYCCDDEAEYWFATKEEAIEKAEELAVKHFINDETKESEEEKC